MTADIDLRIRDANPDDLGFIIDSWLKSWWRAPGVNGMTKDHYYEAYKPRIKAILARETVQVRILGPVDDDSTILGWACTEGELLHYVFVRKSFRLMGWGRQLVGPVTAYTFKTLSMSLAMCPPDGWPRKFKLDYRPDLAF